MSKLSQGSAFSVQVQINKQRQANAKTQAAQHRVLLLQLRQDFAKDLIQA